MRSPRSRSPRTIFPEVVVEANPSSPSLAQPSTTSPVMPPADFSARPPSAPARGRIRNRRRRIQGRGNVAQVINSETHFIDRIKRFFPFASKSSANNSAADPIPIAGSPVVVPPRTTSTVELQEQLPAEELTEDEKMEDLKFYMEQIYLIIKPVICCMALSILWVKLTTEFEENYSTGIDQQSPPQTTVGSSFGFSRNSSGSAFVSALAILGQIVGATILVAILFYFNCMKILYGVFVLIVTALLGTFGWTLASELLSIHNLALDKITFWFFIWNLVAVGVLMIFYKGPLFLQQAYLVLMSSMMAYTLTKLPALTTWILLALLAIWDLIAVLCPFGPLRILVETAQNEEREIPALLYSVMIWMMATPGDPPSSSRPSSTAPTDGTRSTISRRMSAARSDSSSWNVFHDYGDASALIGPSFAVGSGIELEERSKDRSPVAATGPRGEPMPNVSPDSSSARETAGDRPAPSDTAAEVEEEEAARGGLKLGLGDFVFYSVLVARAALFDWITTLACTVAVLTGLNMTIFLLAMYQKALPALPISIAFGILFYFVSAVTLTPFINGLVRRPDKVIVPGAETWLWVGQGGGGGMLYV
ncbi:hypothetical protein PhCBS80983_g00576 [Powellomyces hirtus]|uniref:Presenilin n=1 Tax=Powellomyces hirtus TaxID=109895 RepID=A0A507EGH3_9FUNG|nr:hypothetical protein PhCBS80983_g00576 [Powellomyces hirtus]